MRVFRRARAREDIRRPQVRTLPARIKAKGLVVLAISEEAPDTLRDHVSFPVLVDSGRQVGRACGAGAVHACDGAVAGEARTGRLAL